MKKEITEKLIDLNILNSKKINPETLKDKENLPPNVYKRTYTDYPTEYFVVDNKDISNEDLDTLIKLKQTALLADIYKKVNFFFNLAIVGIAIAGIALVLFLGTLFK